MALGRGGAALGQQKGAHVDRERHLILTAAHPSPLSAHNGFFGCGHFARANEYLVGRGQAPIDWPMAKLAADWS